MSIRITRLSEERRPGEGIRIGAVQRAPRGKPRGAMYELWLPELAPSEKLRRALKRGIPWHEFIRRFKAEMRALERKDSDQYNFAKWRDAQARDSWARARERGNVVSVTVLST